MEDVNVTVNKNKKVYSWNPSTCTCENRKYIKNFGDDSVIGCDEYQ